MFDHIGNSRDVIIAIVCTYCAWNELSIMYFVPGALTNDIASYRMPSDLHFVIYKHFVPPQCGPVPRDAARVMGGTFTIS